MQADQARATPPSVIRQQLQRDLAELLSGFQSAQGFMDAVQRELAVDHRHDTVQLDEGEQVAKLRQVSGGGAQNLQLPDEDAAQLGIATFSALAYLPVYVLWLPGNLGEASKAANGLEFAALKSKKRSQPSSRALER